MSWSARRRRGALWRWVWTTRKRPWNWRRSDGALCRRRRRSGAPGPFRDAKELPFLDASFDVVRLVDVYEHLHPFELDFTLSEARRLLRPGGRLLVHTGPNTWFYRFGYPGALAGAPSPAAGIPEDLRGEYDHLMHVNEQNLAPPAPRPEKAGFAARVQPRSFFTGINPSGLGTGGHASALRPPPGQHLLHQPAGGGHPGRRRART